MNELIHQGESANVSLPSASQASNMMQPAAARQVAEVQASLVIAKQFPRDINQSFNRIIQSCKRVSLAEQAIYSYPRGGAKVEGPSIRLAEALAQAWGNVDSGLIEVEQRNGESTIMAYAWDKETNTREVKQFTVKHERSKRSGNETLTDPRDIYELVANQGARRRRACILAIIPGDIIDAAVEQCNKTLAGASDEPLEDRIRKMVVVFNDAGVKQDELEAFLGHKIDACDNREIARLGKIFKSLSDGIAKKGDFFKPVSDIEKTSDTKPVKKDKPASKTVETPKDKPKDKPAKKEKAEAKKDEPKDKPKPASKSAKTPEEPEVKEEQQAEVAPNELYLKLEENGLKPEDVAEFLANMKDPFLEEGQKLSDLTPEFTQSILDNYADFMVGFDKYREKLATQ